MGQEVKRCKGITAERNITDVIWSVLCHWKLIILAGLLLALFLGSYSFYQSNKQLKDPEEVAKQEEAYRLSVESYRAERESLEKKINTLKEEQQRMEEYSETAVMLFVDQYNTYVCTGSYYINTNYEIAPSLFYQNPNYTSVITNSYRSAINRINWDMIIGEENGVKWTTHNPVSGNSLSLVNTSVDASNGILNYTVYGDTWERAELFAETIQQVLKEQEELLNKVIGDHSLEILSESNRTAFIPEFGTLQTSFTNKVDSVASSIKTNTSKWEAMEEPENKVISLRKLVLDALKQIFIGFGAGVLVVVLLMLLRILFQNRVLSGEELQCRYHHPFLGAFAQDGTKHSRFLKKMGFAHLDSEEQAADYIAANIRYFMKGTTKLLLLGTEDMTSIEKLKGLLESRLENVQIQMGGNVNETPAAIASMTTEATIICVEQYNKSVHKNVANEISFVQASGNKDVGFVLSI